MKIYIKKKEEDLLDLFPVVVQTLYREHPEPLWDFSRFHLMSMLTKTEDFSFF
jgi:hypothetical protein